MEWKNPWNKKQLVCLLLIAFAAVPIFIEYLLKNALDLLLGKGMSSAMLMGIAMAAAFILSLYDIALKPDRLSWREIGISRFAPAYWIQIAGWTVFLIVMTSAIMEILTWFGAGYENTKTKTITADLSWLNIAMSFASACIVSPIYEEMFYRGFLYRWFRAEFGVVWALVASSALFMIAHIPTYNTLAVNFATGLVFAWTYEKTQSIIPAMLIHSLFNAILLFFTILLT
ncbi:CPBP family intramembrane glutamic endopeptidase [Bacillus paralicheniformis]|uniref:CPBP family intramembrane glutamic endopeptidase n=1 Tax=Bacillus paralicheniformis TaxID=1648923 RepID=UPI00363A4ADA